jgi:hypothetical protein
MIQLLRSVKINLSMEYMIKDLYIYREREYDSHGIELEEKMDCE